MSDQFKLPTRKVVHKESGTEMVINVEDFDAAQHEPVEPARKKLNAPVKPSAKKDEE